MRENVQNFVKFFWHGSQNCFLCVQRTFLKKNFSFSKSLQNSKISDVFRLWGKHFGFLAKIILLGCQNCFQVSSGYFWKTFFENKFLELFIYFWSSGTIFLDFRRKFCDWFVKTFSKLRGDIFRQNWCLKTNFLSFFFNFGLRAQKSGLLDKIFRQLCQNCILCVQWRFLIGL